MKTSITEIASSGGDATEDEREEESCTSPTQTKCLWRSKQMTCACRDCATLKNLRICMGPKAVCSAGFVFCIYGFIFPNWGLFLRAHGTESCQSPSLSFTGGILSLRTEALAFNTSLAALLCIDTWRMRNRMWNRNPANHLLLADRIRKICFRTLATMFTICIASVVLPGLSWIPEIVHGYDNIVNKRAVSIDIIFHLILTVILIATVTVMFLRLVDIHVGYLIGYKYRKALFDRDLCGERPVLLWSSKDAIIEKCLDGVKIGVILFVIGVTLPMWVIFYLKGSQGPNECWSMEIWKSPLFPFFALLPLSWEAFIIEIKLRLLVGKRKLEAFSADVIEREAFPVMRDKFGNGGHTNSCGNHNIPYRRLFSKTT